MTTFPNAEPSAVPRRERIASALAAAPLLAPAIGLAAGILVDSRAALPAAVYVATFAASGAALVVLRRRAIACAAALLVAASAVGAVLHQGAFRRIPSDHVVRYTSERSIEACVTGTLISEPSLIRANYGAFNAWTPRPVRTRFLVEAESIDGVHGPIHVRGLVRVSVGEPMLTLQAGQRVRVFGRMYRPVPPANPGERDWALQHRRRGLIVGMSCEHAACVTPIGSPARGGGDRVARFRRYCRRLLLDDVIPNDAADVSVLEAILLGQRSAVDRAINDAFVATGAVHILSVSGAHLGMLGGAVWSVAALLGRSRRQAAILVLVAVLGYAALAEPNAPILRSAVMATLLCIGLPFGRPVRTANWLAASVLLVLAIRPCDLFDPGFQLSYVTLAGVVYLSPAVRDAWRCVLRRRDEIAALIPREPPFARYARLRSAATKLEWALAVAVAAWLMGAPLALYHFGQTSTWGWLNSLLIAPFVALVMMAGFGKLLAAAIWPSLGSALAPVLAAATSLLDHWVRWLAAVPGVSLMGPSPPVWLVVAAIGVLGAWAARRALAIPAHAVGAAALATVVLAAFWHWPGTPRDDELRVRALAVGDGSATLIRFPNGRAILYDVGTTPPYEMYRQTLRPVLAAERVRRLDAVLLSHPNLDHFSGLLDLHDHVPIGTVWITSHFGRVGLPGGPDAFLLEQLARRGVAIAHLHRGDRLTRTGGVEADVLWPPPYDERDPLAPNDTSIVLRLRHHGRSILLCGDIEQAAQRRLLDRDDLHADVLVLPHHGSFKAWTPTFVHAVAPMHVVRSSGKRSDVSLAGLNDLMRDYDYANTADVGSVLVRLGPAGVTIERFRRTIQ